MLSPKSHFRLKDTYRLKVRGWKNIFHANGKQKKAGVAILISDKIDIIYAPNIGALLYIKQTLTDIKGETDSNTIIVGDFNIPLTTRGRSSKQKLSKEAQVLHDTLDEMDPINIFSTFHPNAEEYTFFSSAHGTFSRIDHILSHKSNLSKFKKTELVFSIFSDHNAIRLDIN